MEQKVSWEPKTQAITNKKLRRANLIQMMTYGKTSLKIRLLIQIQSNDQEHLRLWTNHPDNHPQKKTGETKAITKSNPLHHHWLL